MSSKMSEPSHRLHFLKPRKNRSELNLPRLGVEQERSEQERPVYPALTALAPFHRTHTRLAALSDTFASIATQIFEESYWLVQTS